MKRLIATLVLGIVLGVCGTCLLERGKSVVKPSHIYVQDSTSLAKIDSLDTVISDLRRKRVGNKAGIAKHDTILATKIDSVLGLPASEQTEMFARNYANRPDSIKGDLSHDELVTGILSANVTWVKLEASSSLVGLLKADIMDADSLIAALGARGVELVAVIDDLRRENANLAADMEAVEKLLYKERWKYRLTLVGGAVLLVLVAI